MFWLAMKNLKDILVEKLKVDDIVLGEKFPIDGTVEDMIEFLEDAGFVPVEENHNYKGSVDDIFDYNNTKCFLKENKRFWFADTSKEKISKSNPIFFIVMPEKIFKVYYCNNYNTIDIVEDNKKEFLKELNKRFSWE